MHYLIVAGTILLLNSAAQGIEWCNSSSYDLKPQQSVSCSSLVLNQLNYTQPSIDTCPTNPERGWFFFTDVRTSGYINLQVSVLQNLRQNQNTTLIYRGVILDSHRNTSISQQTLSSLSTDFSIIRTAGVKVILRFLYTNVFTSPRNDSSKSIVLEHISQLGPVLTANADVILSIQHGFIGTWGEGYYTDHFGDGGIVTAQQMNDRRDVFNAILDNFPKCRMLQVRTWPFKQILTGVEQPVQLDNAFMLINDSSGNSRTGIHDDCFLASETDQGTWLDSAVDKPLLSQHTRYTMMGGESCFVNLTNYERPLCPTATEELENFHFTFLNRAYYGPILDAWRTGGCYNEISCRLGYNLVLVSSRFPSELEIGNELCFELTLRNDGYAPPYNKHRVVLVLNKDNEQLSFELNGENTDPRAWAGNGTLHTVKASVLLNDTEVALGQWNLFMSLQDEATTLRNRSEYNIVFSNPGIVTSDRLNDLNTTIIVSCHCNGHISQCSNTSTPPSSCDCIHNTDGSMCEICQPLYNDKLWRQGTLSNNFPCKLCNCNNHSVSCHYDSSVDTHPDSYELGGGGVCDNCQHNTSGRYCETCVIGFYRQTGVSQTAQDACVACQCNTAGSESVDCAKENSTAGVAAGQCTCKQNVIGLKCDTCKAGFQHLGSSNPLGCSAVVPEWCSSSSYDLQSQQSVSCSSVLVLNQLNYTQPSIDTCPTNPERGWHFFTDVRTSSYSNLQVTVLQNLRENQNTTLIYRGVILDSHRNTSISQQTLSSLSTDFSIIRTAGVKVILRFMYTNVFTSPRNDASKSIVLEHISQLGPVLTANADVILSIQQGFIGTWGGGLYTDHFGDGGIVTAQQMNDRRDVFNAILDNFPKCRMLQVRTWPSKQILTGMEQPVQLDNAFMLINDSSGNSRTGIHDDCFLASETDQGTWLDSAVDKPLLSQHTRYTMMGGESCFVNLTNYERPLCPTATEELENFHFTFLNRANYGPILDAWRTGGCYNEISCRLGYKLVLVSSRFPSELEIGNELCFELTLRNDGYAPPYNKHRVVLVLSKDDEQLSFELDGENTDPRAWAGNRTLHTVKASVLLSDADVALGQWNLFLSLQDEATTLRNRSDYNIVFSNPGIATSDRLNDLNTTINVVSCHCNGHISQCSNTSTPPSSCDCIHNTNGSMCEICQPLYNDKLWRQGTLSNNFPCKLCNCNNHSVSCHYNSSVDTHPDSYELGGGGVCDNCQHNTSGRYCETCVIGFYCQTGVSQTAEDACVACQCNSAGSESVDCAKENSTAGVAAGQCTCKQNVIGLKCDTCKAGFQHLGSSNPLGCSAVVPEWCSSSSYDLQSQQSVSCSSVLVLNQLNYTQPSIDTCPTNPERGWHLFTDVRTSSYSNLQVSVLQNLRENQNTTLIYRGVILDSHRNTSISQQTLSSLSTDFSIIRTVGLKVVLRFMYTNVFTSPRNDASKSIVLEHISQLGPVLTANADVILSIQHGFIGTWGEGYYTDHFGDGGNVTVQQMNDRRDVFNAILDNFPKCRMLQVRTWSFKQILTGMEQPVQLDNAFMLINDSSGNSRTGIHDDCFLASETDQGTWLDSAIDKPLLSQHTRYTMMGGESCFVNLTNYERSLCPTATEELENFHFTFLNRAYYGPILDAWRTGGCYNEISCRLGYNLVLVSLRFPSELEIGNELCFELTLKNDGYAPPYNKHRVVLVLSKDNEQLSFELNGENTDPRAWAGNRTLHTVKASVLLNDTEVALGQWNLFLSLQDEATTLRNRSEYNIVFSNPGIATSDRLNDLNTTINVVRCHCNGHISQCSNTSTPPSSCDCIHNTNGSMCEICQPLYNDKLWRQGTLSNNFPCKLCNCNNHSVSCHYNSSVDTHSDSYELGGGGVCDNCQHNTSGRYCQTCAFGFYRQEEVSLTAENACVACQCNSAGSESVDCVKDTSTVGIAAGQCNCIANVEGLKCNQCMAGYFNFTINGCQECNCNISGSVGNSCDQTTGQCSCKANVIGLKCDVCRNGYESLIESNLLGCSLSPIRTPVNLTNSSTSARSISLTWSPPGDAGTADVHYTVRYSDANLTISIMIVTNTIEIKDLTPNTVYTFYITADFESDGPYNRTSSITVMTIVSTPSRPRNVTLTDLLVSWKIPENLHGETLSHYQVLGSFTITTNEGRLLGITDETMFELPVSFTAEARQQYIFVRALSTGGIGELSEPVVFIPGQPSSLAAVAAGLAVGSVAIIIAITTIVLVVVYIIHRRKYISLLKSRPLPEIVIYEEIALRKASAANILTLTNPLADKCGKMEIPTMSNDDEDEPHYI